ncbi:MAG: flagellar biosynthesis protein FlgA [Deltaproteobacteria bacterium HGW-Deltaproteobacteria-7]|nr:MAG: flagellar biosynthesis protein FlgA [Deltaproteobacteria bacterium HGW-Deltaproteobacteria-7]PKN20767.1 MAG: flagellar biosynthesis protein FlgA [Deltaproteobacteria bacterium HGW-Deltaproteobacteria-6]
MKRQQLSISLLAMIIICVWTSVAFAARIKDISTIGGVRENQLIGYGVIVGLAGTGDDLAKNLYTAASLASIMNRQGISMKDKTAALKAVNIAAVMVTATLPPFVKNGSKIDVMVSSVGSAKSLQGGTLLMTPLRGADGEVYAVAQGAISLGGYSAGGAAGSVVKNHTRVGRIASGATVEKELAYDFDAKRVLMINLQQPDFTTATRMTSAINKALDFVEAKQLDAFSVSVKANASFAGSLSEMVYYIESLDVPVDAPAVVILNEKTGTVVMGENVRISTVAVAHGNLSIQIKEDMKVSQPLPFAPAPRAGGRALADRADAVRAQAGRPPVPASPGTTIAPGGQTVVTTQTTVGIAEEKRQLMLVPQTVTIFDVVRALNAIGVSPRDLITILQSIKAAGALQADIKII